MKISFKKIEVVLIDGKKSVLDLNKDISNIVYNTTKDIGMLEVARALYTKGEVEVKEEQLEIIKKLINENFFAFILEGVNKYFELLKK